ncbi:MarR family winged helix-turn-helix transcriptional regulator [Rhodococcoides kyotonense]|uniref:DNA-binding transcriptional regulator, MarR family n=1 Tax=Rhodococcoides kyotonense TaxID=398843 RepID=A0A239KZ05_9NOCA|nr:MarR family transcriptional regulator [Rhodococcus kyotonensis]SNT23576.1 DNA-binding transcriptional regulator, MarR family [Rhodococcus kyotonensis]
MSLPERPDRALDTDRLVASVDRIVSERMRAVLAPAHVELEEWRVLSLLSDGDGHTMAETADFALLPPPTLTKVVNRLVANNLVHRRSGTVDRRQVLIRNTARGQQKYDALAGEIEAVHRRLFGADSDRELLEGLLAAVHHTASADDRVDH